MSWTTSRSVAPRARRTRMIRTAGGLYVPDELHQEVTRAQAKGKPPLVLSDKSLRAVFDVLSHLDWRDIVVLLKYWTTMPDAEIKEIIAYSDQFYKALADQGMKPRNVRKDLIRRWVRPQVGRHYMTGVAL